MTAGKTPSTAALVGLRDILDRRGRLYAELADAEDFGAYCELQPVHDDEEILTEPILADFIERVLGFPADAYFPQLGKSGLKPDFTPMDLIAHPYVLDAKSSRQKLPAHEGQIRAYIKQRQLDLWYSVRGKTPRDVWRNYEPKRMKEIPYRHVDFSVKAPGERLRKLKAALKKEDAAGAAELAGSIAADLRAAGDAGLAGDAPQAVEAGRALEQVVRAIADNRRVLLTFRDRFPELTRVVKDPWSTEPAAPAPDAFVAALPARQRASVRVDPELTCSIDTDGSVGRAVIEGDALVFTYRRQAVARVEGPRDRLVLLEELVRLATGRIMPDDLLATEVPRDIESFREAVGRATEEVTDLVAAGRVLVEAAERLVCALYAVPTDLEDEVVAHAVARAADRYAT